jgi:hypothetical protein
MGMFDILFISAGVIESNMHAENINDLTKGWSANGLIDVNPGFRLISLPYPTSVTSSKVYHLNVQSTGHNRSRSILALFYGSTDRGRVSNTGRNGFANLVRSSVVDSMRTRSGAVCVNDACAICTKGQELDCKSLVEKYSDERHWELVANSVFCIEPPGDTLTRSHFYLAVQSGCIPVIVDGGDGSPLYGQTPTYWPWRLFANSTQNTTKLSQVVNQIGLNYSKFSLICDASEVMSDPVFFLENLITFPDRYPKRLLSLQLGVDEASPSFIYAPAVSLLKPVQNDAFARFFALVAQLSCK